jgi:drug/metabolite transporter (DMT)-like permease
MGDGNSSGAMRRRQSGVAARAMAPAPRRLYKPAHAPPALAPPGAMNAPIGAVAVMAEDRGQRLALPLLVFGCVVLGLSGLFVKASETGPIATGFYRTAIAAPLFFAALFFIPAGRTAEPARRRDYVWIVVAGLAFAGDLAVWHWSLLMTSVANATFIGNLSTIFVTLGAWFAFGQRPTRLFGLGLAVTLAGAAVLAAGSFALDARAFEGDLLSFAAALFWALYILAIAEARKRVSSAAIMAISSAVCAAVLLPLAWATGEIMAPATARGWALVIGFALVCHVLGQGLLAHGLAHVRAALASVVLLVQPVAASIFAWWLLGEALGWHQIVGGAVVLAGILVAKRGSPGP